jgi:hypothetical protein
MNVRLATPLPLPEDGHVSHLSYSGLVSVPPSTLAHGFGGDSTIMHFDFAIALPVNITATILQTYNSKFMCV